jgi:hypothetical protein
VAKIYKYFYTYPVSVTEFQRVCDEAEYWVQTSSEAR